MSIARPVRRRRARVANADGPGPVPSPAAFPEFVPGRIRVLVVDDDQENVALITRLLQREGYPVRTANDGPAGLRLAAAWRPDLVVSDVLMPGMSGLEMCRRIRQSPAHEGAMVALISSLETSSDSTVAGLESGADTYIVRPIANRELVARVNALARIQQAGVALRKSERRFHTLAETAPVGIVRTDERGACVFVNRRWCELCGRSPEEILGHPWSLPVWREDIARVRAAWRKAEAGGRIMTVENRIRRPDGTLRWVLAQATAELGPDQQPVAYVAGMVDITERRRMEEELAALSRSLEQRVKERTAQLEAANRQLQAEIQERIRTEAELRASEARFAAFMATAPLCAWIKDSRFRYLYVNREVERVLGRPAAGWVGRTDSQIFGRALARPARRDDRTALRGGVPISLTEVMPNRHGQLRHFLTFKFPITDARGRRCPAGVAMDITEKIEAQEALKELPRRILEAQEGERRRVSRELHDGVGQVLSSMGFRCQAVMNRILELGDPKLSKATGGIKKLLDAALREVRHISQDLRPSELDDFGVSSAIRELANHFRERAGTRLTLDLPRGLRRLPREVELALYRIAQEALANVERHARATAVAVSLRKSAKHLALTVSDNGAGFGPRKRARNGGRGGLGLINMRERAEFIGGVLSVQSKPRGGTTVEVFVPLRRGK